MSHTTSRARPVIVVALTLLCALTGALLVTVTFGFSAEYADTGADAATLAASTLGDWAMFLVVPGLFAAAAIAVARRHARLRVLSVTALLLTLTTAGVAGSGVLGAAAKYERYPSVPSCTDEFLGGPAYPVVHAAQDAYDELDHPGAFSGGENSGLDGCQSQLMVRGDGDVVGAYRDTLTDKGWRITAGASGESLQAVRGDQAFELTHGDHGHWWVWIGPRDLPRRQLDEGQVGLGAR
jgi:hypothetical protein